VRWAVYVDMDAFYASCELKRHPELRGVPFAVSADPRGGAGRGVVLSASYEARAKGLRSAMPVSQAFALCPEYRWVLPDFAFYEENSRQVMALLRARSADSRSFSIDEAAYPFESISPSEVEVEAREVQRQVREACALPCSIGVAPTLTLAKIASDRAKPGGVVVIAPDSVATFLAPLPVRAIPGIGRVTEAALEAAAVRTLADLARTPVERLRRPLGGMAGSLHDLARGVVHEEPWPEEEGPRSRGAMSTFDRDTSEPSDVLSELDRLSRSLSESLAKEGRMFRTVTVRIRRSDFQQLQRSRTLPQRTADPGTLSRTVRQLAESVLQEERSRSRATQRPLSEPGNARGNAVRRFGVRTVGISVSDLAPSLGAQRSLDDLSSSRA
jgi:DNA polymerase IV (archaeal DinB-like DNA polymerase)